MNCPDCKYIMSPFDVECPRCARYNTPHPAPQPVAELPPPVAFVPPPYQPPLSDMPAPPSDTFVPSPYQSLPSDTPAPPMHPVASVFLGIMLSIGAIIVITGAIVLVAILIGGSRTTAPSP